MFIHINSNYVQISFNYFHFIFMRKKEIEQWKINCFQDHSGLDFTMADGRARAHSSQQSKNLKQKEIA